MQDQDRLQQPGDALYQSGRCDMTNASQKSEHKQLIIDPAILDGLAEDVVVQLHPCIADRPNAFHAFVAAHAALLREPLDALADAYRQAAGTPAGRLAARQFLSTLLESEA